MDPSKRNRSYSRDTAAYLSESSSSLSGYHAGNRSRANTSGTDDSTLSSSENSSKHTTILGPRRRSHRPRGCRGGRKNRKNKNNSALPVPTEIIGGNITPLSPRDNLRQPGSAHTEGELKRDHPTAKLWSNLSTPDENAIHTANFPALSQTTQSSSQSHKDHVPNPFLLRPPVVVVVDQSSFLPPHANCTANQVGHSSATGMGDILPPLPIAVSNNNRPDWQGPNPYALSQSKDSMGRYGAMKPSNKLSITIKPPAYSNQPQGIGLTVDYRSQRIEKQRQMLADGGSLFATSPRTFLMGGAVAISW